MSAQNLTLSKKIDFQSPARVITVSFLKHGGKKFRHDKVILLLKDVWRTEGLNTFRRKREAAGQRNEKKEKRKTTLR